MNEMFRQRDPAALVSWAVAPSSPERRSRALKRLAEVARRFDLPVYTPNGVMKKSISYLLDQAYGKS